MGKLNPRLEAARKSYREALEAARTQPSPEAWARLLAAGKELSAAEEPRQSRSGRRSRRAATPSIHDLEDRPAEDAVELSDASEGVEPADAPDAEPKEFEHAD